MTHFVSVLLFFWRWNQHFSPDLDSSLLSILYITCTLSSRGGVGETVYMNIFPKVCKLCFLEAEIKVTLFVLIYFKKHSFDQTTKLVWKKLLNCVFLFQASADAIQVFLVCNLFLFSYVLRDEAEYLLPSRI